jgi:hypothetical protein
MMQAAEQTVSTREEYAVYCLERSAAGLKSLAWIARECGECFEEGRQVEALERFSQIANGIHGFNVFECRLIKDLMLDREQVVLDGRTYADAVTSLRALLPALVDCLESSDTETLHAMVASELPKQLNGVAAFLPVLSETISCTEE